MKNFNRAVLYSFDVFDTVITRNTATPIGIFALAEYELLKNSHYADIPRRYRENFFVLRRNAERLATAIYDAVVAIDTIYEVLGSNKDILTNQLELIKQLELEIEYTNCVPINENIEKIRLLLQNGERVVFISDMYLSSKHIRKLICKHAPDFNDIPIYVSCEYGCNKLSGKLFEKVRKSENCEFKEWIHTGDNLRTDIDGAAKNGITALKYDYPALHLFERNLLKYYGGDASLQIAIGTARNVRMKEGFACGKFNNEFAYGCSYGAPMIYSYVSWVLKHCAEKGIKRLYFTSRDGYILKIVADCLIEKYELNVKTKYIYGSRKAWTPAGFNRERDLVFPHYLKLRTIMNYFDITAEDVKKYITDIDSEEFWTSDQLEEINQNIEFKEYLEETQKNKALITQRYLLQELDFSDDNFAFVELQGTGLCLGSALSLLKPFYKKRIRTFWCCRQFGTTGLRTHNMDTYIYLYKNDTAGAYIENICRAPHGLTIGYEENDGNVIPVFGDKDYENFDFKAYVDGVKYFTAEYANISGINDNINVFTKYYNIRLQQKDDELMKFHTIFHHNQLELGNDGKKDIISRLNTSFNGLKIAIYGAGKCGKEFRHKLGNRCVAWFDLAYEDYLSQGYSISNPYEINTNNSNVFDVIIVAIEARTVFDEVRDFLNSVSVPKEKIFWIKNI